VEQIMHAAVVDLYFTRAGKAQFECGEWFGRGKSNGPEPSKSAGRLGTGGVESWNRGTRKATAEAGESTTRQTENS